MAVYDQSYRPYEGSLTRPAWRFLILPRYALGQVFGYRLFTAFFAACFFLPVGAAVLIYLRHNVSALTALQLDAAEILPVNAWFFSGLMGLQSFLPFGIVLAVLVGPGLVSADLANNALPLYFSRPFSRTEYVLGKMSVLVLLLSAVTWIPGLLLFTLQASLEGRAWLAEYGHVGLAIPVGCGTWIVVISLLCLAVSALVKRKIAAQATLFALVVGGAAFGAVLDSTLHTRYGLLFNLPWVMKAVWGQLYGIPQPDPLPGAAPWLALAALCGACLVVLRLRLKAYEVVR